MDSNFKYTPDGDVFYIQRNDSTNDVFSSLPIGNFVFDIDTSGKVVGLEIDNASEVFGVSRDTISKAKSATLGTTLQGNILLIHFFVDLGIKNYNFSYVFPRTKIPIAA